MRSRALFCIATASVCGMVASIGLSQLLEPTATTLARSQSRQRIYVAQCDLLPGQVLSEQNLVLQNWDAEALPPGTIVRLEDVLGRTCRETVRRGEPIQAGLLRVPGQAADEQQLAVAPPTVAPPQSPVTAPATAAVLPAAPAPPAESGTPIAPPAADTATTPIPTPPPAVAATQPEPRESPTPAPPVPPAPARRDVANSSRMVPSSPVGSVRIAAPRPAAASGEISDAGWVMTVHKRSGTKLLRWQPATPSGAATDSPPAAEQIARPPSDPRQG